MAGVYQKWVYISREKIAQRQLYMTKIVNNAVTARNHHELADMNDVIRHCRYGESRLSSLGKGMVSLTCCIPHIQARVLSTPRPKPAWGNVP